MVLADFKCKGQAKEFKVQGSKFKVPPLEGEGIRGKNFGNRYIPPEIGGL